jgi:hypothetical protein
MLNMRNCFALLLLSTLFPLATHAFFIFNGYIEIGSSGTTNWYSVDGTEGNALPQTIEDSQVRILNADVLTDPGYGGPDSCDEVYFLYRVNSGTWNQVPMVFDQNVDGSDKWRLDSALGPFPDGAEVAFYLSGRGDGFPYGDPDSGSSWPLIRTLGSSSEPFTFSCGASQAAEFFSINYDPDAWGEQIEGETFHVSVQVAGAYHESGVLQVAMQSRDTSTFVTRWLAVSGAASRNDTFELALPSSGVPQETLMLWVQFRPGATQGPLNSSMLGDVIERGPDFLMFWRNPTGFQFTESYVQIGNATTSFWYGLSGTGHAHLPAEIALAGAAILNMDVLTSPGRASYNACDEVFLNFQVNDGVWQRKPLTFLENINDQDKWTLTESVGPFDADDTVRLYLNGRGDGLTYNEGDIHGRWVVFDEDRSRSHPYTFRLQSGEKADIHQVNLRSPTTGWQAVAGRTFGVEVEVQATVPVPGLLQVTIFAEGTSGMFQGWSYVSAAGSVSRTLQINLEKADAGVQTYATYVQFRPGVTSGPINDSRLQDTVHWAPEGLTVEWWMPDGFSFFDSYARIGDMIDSEWYGLSGDGHPPLPETRSGNELWIHELDVKTWPGAASYNACDHVALFYRVGGGVWRSVPLEFETNVMDADKWRLPTPLGPFPAGANLRFYLRGYSDGLYYHESITHGEWIIQSNERSVSNPYTVRVEDGEVPAGATISGVITARDPAGRAAGALAGALVELSPGASVSTSTDGFYRFEGLAAGSYTLTVGKNGYAEETRSVTLTADGNQVLSISLLQAAGDGPVLTRWEALHGSHFMVGHTGVVSFTGEIDWNGDPGMAHVRAGDRRFEGTLTPLGSGRSAVRFDVTVPDFLLTPSALRLELVNAQGDRREIPNQNVYFYPVPLLLAQFWPNDIFPIEHDLVFKRGHKLKTPDFKILKTEAGVGMEFKLSLSPEKGQAKVNLKGEGHLKLEIELQGAEVMGEIRVGANGHCTVQFNGFNLPDITPGWKLTLGGKAGAAAPLVPIVLNLVPGATPFIDTALHVPVVGDVLSALKLGLYLSLAGNVEGKYADGYNPDAFLGTSSIEAELVAAIEGRAFAELMGAEVGAYLRGEGTVSLDVVPDIEITGIALDAYLGMYVEIWFYEASVEYVFPLYLSESEEQPRQMMMQAARASIGEQEMALQWQPLGTRAQAASTVDSGMTILSDTSITSTLDLTGMTISEQVVSIASPTLHRQGDAQLLLFVHFDPAQPLHASTRILQAHRTPGTDAWALAPVTSGEQGEFHPAYISRPGTDSFATWSAYTGGPLVTMTPQEVEAGMEIFAALRDDTSGAWGPAFRVSEGNGHHLQPRAIRSENQPAVCWIYKDLQETGSNDVVRIAQWNGTEWTGHAEILRTTATIVDYIALVDETGDTHILLIQDPDRSPLTADDKTLTYLHTDQGIWQPPVSLTTASPFISDVLLVLLDDAPFAAWLDNGDVYGSTLSTWTPVPLRQPEQAAMQAVALTGTTTDHGAALVYVDTVGGGSDLYAIFYDHTLGEWSFPVQLTDDAHQPNAPTVAWDSAAQKISVGYIRTLIEYGERIIIVDGEPVVVPNAPIPGRKDLVVLDHYLGVDLAILPGSLATDPAFVAPGTTALVQFVYLNRGEQPAPARIRLQHGPELLQEWLLAETDWVPGQFYTASVAWVISPDTVLTTLYASIEPINESYVDRDYSNNTGHMQPMRPGIRFQQLTHQVLDDDRLALVFEFANEGTAATEETPVEIRLDDPAGAVIGTFIVPALAAGGSTQEVLVWDVTASGISNQQARLVIVFDSETASLDTPESLVQTLAWSPQTTATGIPVAWLRQHGLPEDGSVDHLDMDGDGMTVFEEWRAGTQPTNRFSVFTLEMPREAPGRRLSWPSLPDRIYHIQGSTNLLAHPAFETIEVRGGSADNHLDLETDYPEFRFFRIHVD